MRQESKENNSTAIIIHALHPLPSSQSPPSAGCRARLRQRIVFAAYQSLQRSDEFDDVSMKELCGITLLILSIGLVAGQIVLFAAKADNANDFVVPTCVGSSVSLMLGLLTFAPRIFNYYVRHYFANDRDLATVSTLRSALYGPRIASPMSVIQEENENDAKRELPNLS